MGEIFLIVERDGNDKRILGYARTQKEAETFCGDYNSQPGKRNHKWYVESVSEIKNWQTVSIFNL